MDNTVRPVWSPVLPVIFFLIIPDLPPSLSLTGIILLPPLALPFPPSIIERIVRLSMPIVFSNSSDAFFFALAGAFLSAIICLDCLIFSLFLTMQRKVSVISSGAGRPSRLAGGLTHKGGTIIFLRIKNCG